MPGVTVTGGAALGFVPVRMADGAEEPAAQNKIPQLPAPSGRRRPWLPGLERSGSIGDYRIVVLAQRYGIRLARASEQMGIAEATSDIAKRLDVEPGHKLLKLDRVIFATDGRPVEWQVGMCRLKKDS